MTPETWHAEFDAINAGLEANPTEEERGDLLQALDSLDYEDGLDYLTERGSHPWNS